MIEYYDRQRQPLTLKQWVESRQDKRVGLDEITVGDRTFRVSTVWLGLNHQFGDGPPLIFETMVFADGSSMDLECECERYSTETEAVAGHQAMVEHVRATYSAGSL